MNKFSKMKVHWWTYNHCLIVSYLTSVAFGYGWISDTKFRKFLDKDWIWIFKKFIGYGSGVKKSIFAHLCCEPLEWRISCRYHYIFRNILQSVQSLILHGQFQNFHRKLFYAQYRIQSTHTYAFSSFHFTLCALFYLSFWSVSYMEATATFQLTFPEAG